MNRLGRSSAVFAIAAFCGSCASGPVGYRVVKTDESLVVTREFQFTAGRSSASPMQHTWTVPAGIYRAVATDSTGTYFEAPRTLPLKARSTVRENGGLYRRGTTFFIYGQPLLPNTSELAILLLRKPHIFDQVPPEFSKVITPR
jgi:hypothetical protein